MNRDDEQDYRRPSDRVEKYNELPSSTRYWLETRRKDDWDRIDRALKFYDRVQDRGKFFVWLVMGGLTILFGFTASADQVIRILNWLRGHP